MSNKKAQIAEVLFDGKELRSEDILFVLSHIPDENNQKGEFNSTPLLPFDHNAKSMYKACGITKEDFDTMSKKVVDALMDHDAASEGVEALLKYVKQDEKRLISLIVFTLGQADDYIKLKATGPDFGMLSKGAKAIRISPNDIGIEGAKELAGQIVKILMTKGGLSREDVKKKLDLDEDQLRDLLGE